MLKVGDIYITAGVKESLISDDRVDEVTNALRRHIMCDWGDISDHDKEVNEEALKDGDRILSSYNVSFGQIWIITEWDRKTTTILFPSEY